MKAEDDEDNVIRNVETHEEISEEEKAKLRELLMDPDTKLILAPEVEEEMREAGITRQQIIDHMKKLASNKLQ